MRLLAKTSLYYLLFSIPILMVSGFICFYVISKEVKDSNDELLLKRKIEVEHYLKDNDTVALLFITKSNEAKINKMATFHFKKVAAPVFSDTLILDKEENELAPNRMIAANVKTEKGFYQIKIWRSTLEFDELIEGILYLLAFILFFLFLASMLINFWISKTLWKPFYNTVSNLKTFRTSNNDIPSFEKTSVKEFEILNHSLLQMMEKMIVDYTSQKKFTENASHEIQTPLAVIQSKVDLLIQSPNLQEKEVELITAIDNACTRLVRLNKSLLLLAKIENRQFKTTEKISVKNMIDQSLALFEEHITINNITVVEEMEEDFLIQMNADLCLILINNLLQNAIRHNVENGKIIIFITAYSLSIQNTGEEKPLDESLLFKRFQKKSASHLSTGLGLAIAKEIAEVSGLSLKYRFIDNEHCFTLIDK